MNQQINLFNGQNQTIKILSKVLSLYIVFQHVTIKKR